MCGIFGIITGEEVTLGLILIESGKRLAYRGYDSVGCATVGDDGANRLRIDLRKGVGRIEDVSARLGFPEMRGRRGIIQLRWATFGAPSYENAQPHLDSDGDLVGAHNGNVVNNVQLRELFLREGLTVRGTNDGETCVHAVERHFDRNGAPTGATCWPPSALPITTWREITPLSSPTATSSGCTPSKRAAAWSPAWARGSPASRRTCPACCR
jgi:glucosamine 6-phosphate synthetase-like amidotransferase/phosphosugar isomerase protein